MIILFNSYLILGCFCLGLHSIETAFCWCWSRFYMAITLGLHRVASKLQSIRYDVAAIAIHDVTLKSRCLDLGRDCDLVILIVFTIFFFRNSSRNIENLNVTDIIASQLGFDNLMPSFSNLNIKTIFEKKTHYDNSFWLWDF